MCVCVFVCMFVSLLHYPLNFPRLLRYATSRKRRVTLSGAYCQQKLAS